MAGGNKAEDGLHENAIGWGILGVVFAVIIWLIWHHFHVELRDLVRWIRYGEMWLVSWFVDDDYTILFNGSEANWQRGFEDTPNFRAQDLGYMHLTYFTALAMQPMKIFYSVLFGLAGLWCMFYGPGTNYRRSLDLDALIARQARSFPVIQPFVKFNPSTQPPRAPGSPVPADLPDFAEALGPEEWIAYNEIPVPDGKLNEAAAAKAFRKQLVGRWKGYKALKPHQQILLAAFCLKAARKRGDADNMLGRLAMCWSFKGKGKLNLSSDRKLLREARTVLKNKDLAGKTLAQCNRHAFVTTALLRALQFAREEGGVLAPAQFVWLRAYDRTLWYPLNNLGRQSFHMEAFGAMSHFKSERMTQRPIPIPKVESALEALKEYLGSDNIRPIPQLDYSNSKRRGVKKAK